MGEELVDICASHSSETWYHLWQMSEWLERSLSLLWENAYFF